jgi:DNA-binding transcriptional LysR family regulator
VRPTRAGRALYPHAAEGLRALAQASAALGRGDARGECRLSIAASHTIGTFVLPQWLTAFAATRRTVPEVSVVNSRSVLAAVHDREVDIGFLPDPSSLDQLDAFEVGQDELVVVVGAEHKWARVPSIAPSQLTGESFFTREQGSGTRTASFASLRELGVELQPELEMSSIEALKRTLQSGGFTIMSCLAISDEILRNQLYPVHLTGARLYRRLFAVRHRDVQLKHAAQHFWFWLEHTPRLTTIDTAWAGRHPDEAGGEPLRA